MTRETLANQMSRESFGATLRAQRQARGLRLSDVAERSDLSSQGVSRLELGQRTPTARTLVRLAGALGVRFSVDAGGVQIID